jgi:hypothetical protein
MEKTTMQGDLDPTMSGRSPPNHEAGHYTGLHERTHEAIRVTALSFSLSHRKRIYSLATIWEALSNLARTVGYSTHTCP